MIGAALTACALAALAAGPAQPYPPIALDLERCPALPRNEVLRLLSLELETAVVPAAAATAGATRLEVSCAGPRVEMRALVPDGRRLHEVMVLPSIEAPVAPRLVALAAAELVAVSRTTEPAAPPASAPAATAAAAVVAPPAVEVQAPRPPQALYLLGMGEVVGPFERLGPAWGAGIRGGWESARVAAVGRAVEATLSAAVADTASTLGSVRATLWSVTPRAVARLRRGPAWIDLGGGARFGIARLAGSPADPTAARGGTVAGAWGAAIAVAGAGVRVSRLLIAAGVEAGWVLRSVDGVVDGERAISVAGGFVSGQLGVGFAW